MELTFKQKIIAFAVMLAIFMGSVFIKQWIDGRALNTVADSSEIVVENIEKDTERYDEKISEEKLMVIDVEGAVTYPGIIKIEEGSRVYEAIEEAGGLLDTAYTKNINMAEEVSDGSIIYIPFEEENQGDDKSGDSSNNSAASLVNINTADKSKLMELPGIGESYAQAIIDYREKNGKFNKKEDIMEVSGIAEAKFEKIKDLICIN